MPRRKKFPDECQARFVAGVFDRIEAVRAPDEDRTGFLRVAVERELERREKRKPAPRRPEIDKTEK